MPRAVLFGRTAAASALATVTQTPAYGQLARGCRINMASSPIDAGEGFIIRLLDHDAAMALLAKTEANVGAPIDAAYIDNQRAVIEMANGQKATVLIPWGMQVAIGERIAFQGSYRNPNLPCSYVPNLATQRLN